MINSKGIIRVKVFFPLILAMLIVQAGNSDESYFRIGSEHKKAGEYEKAVEYYLKALEAHEDDDYVYINLISCLIQLEKYEDAVRFAREGFEKYPETMKEKLLTTLTQTAWHYYSTDVTKTERYSLEALELDAKDFNALHYYGLSLRKSRNDKKVRQSVSALIEAFIVNPSHPYVLQNLIQAFNYSAGRYVNTSELEMAKEVVFRYYDFYRKYSEEFEKKEIALPAVHWRISLPFVTKTRSIASNSADSYTDLISVLQEIVDREPDNYIMKNTLGEACTFLGEMVDDLELRRKGLEIRAEAYDDYILVYSPDLTPIVVDPPIYGRLINVDHGLNPTSHSGLRVHAMDFIVYDQDSKNITAGKPVYMPIRGTVTKVVNNSTDYSHVYFDTGQKLTGYISHFQPGSITVQVGQEIAAGEKIGVMGDLVSMVGHLHLEFTNDHHVSHPFVFREYKNIHGDDVANALPAKGEIFFTLEK